MSRTSFSVIFTCLCGIAASASHSVLAGVVTYNGGANAESAWQAAVGRVKLEDFESYPAGMQIPSLPSLGIQFDELAGGGYPFAYAFSEGPPHGPMHLGNFPNGINSINQWNDVVARPISDYDITAFGFWNGDGQADTYVATAYDASGNVLGTAGAYKDTFAGLVSDVAISYIVFGGQTGDGWNHLDGLQTNAVRAIPEPSGITLLLTGFAGVLFMVRRRCTAKRPCLSSFRSAALMFGLLFGVGHIGENAAAAASGDIIDLGLLNADTYSVNPYAINDNGIAVGNCYTSSSVLPFRWSQSTGMTALPGGIGDRPTYINNQNSILMTQGYASGLSTSTILHADGRTESLGMVYAAGMNNTGDVVVGNGYGAACAFAIKMKRNLDDTWETANIGYPLNSYWGVANRINSQGTIIGSTGYGPFTALRYTDTSGPQYILPPESGSSQSQDINNGGTIVGSSGDYNQHAFRYADSLQLLGDADYACSYARAINDDGLIVGQAGKSGVPYQAVAWNTHGNLINLNEWLQRVNPEAASHWSLQDAIDINSSNMILGYGVFDNDGIQRSFVLDATGITVPEPSAIVLCLSGFAGVLFLAYRRHKGKHSVLSVLRSTALVFALALGVCHVGGSTAHAASGDIFNLGTLNSNDTAVSGAAINDNGIAVGHVATASNGQAGFRWSQSIGMTPIPTDLGIPTYINNQNAIVMYMPYVQSGILNPNGQYKYVGGGGCIGMDNSASVLIDNNWPSSSRYWKDSAGDYNSTALGFEACCLNDAGVIAGRQSYCATRWTAADGLQYIGESGSMALGINNQGVIVGQAIFEPYRAGAFLYSDADGMMPLEYSRFPTSVARAVNDDGMIVGQAYTTTEPTEAVAWTADGHLVELHEWLQRVNPQAASHWLLLDAVDVNNSSLILGYGVYDGAYRPFVLDATGIAVPEPPVIALLTTALASVLVVTWRKRVTAIRQ